MISAILFLVQIGVIAVTRGPKYVRRLREPAERPLRIRSILTLTMIVIFWYSYLAYSVVFGTLGFALGALIQAWGTRDHYRQSMGELPIWIRFMVGGLILFSLCATIMAISFALGYNPE